MQSPCFRRRIDTATHKGVEKGTRNAPELSEAPMGGPTAKAENHLERDNAVLGPLVLPQPRERRGAHVPVLRELEEMDLRHDLRPRPEPDVGVDLGDLGERTGFLAQGDEPRIERPPEELGESRADAADVEQGALIVRAHDQGAERVLPLPLPGRDARDHAVEGRLLLDLDPVLRPFTRRVPRIFSLRDDAFQAAGDDGVVVVDPAGLDVVAEHDPIVLPDDHTKERLPLHLRLAHHILVADVADAQGHVGRGERLNEIVLVDLGAGPLPLLQLLEARLPVPHHDDLAVDDRRLLRPHLEVRVPWLDEGHSAVLEPLALAEEADGPRPVPLELVDVIDGIERRLAALREHRLDQEGLRVRSHRVLAAPLPRINSLSPHTRALSRPLSGLMLASPSLY